MVFGLSFIRTAGLILVKFSISALQGKREFKTDAQRPITTNDQSFTTSKPDPASSSSP
jgi:hypothetical protein